MFAIYMQNREERVSSSTDMTAHGHKDGKSEFWKETKREEASTQTTQSSAEMDTSLCW